MAKKNTVKKTTAPKEVKPVVETPKEVKAEDVKPNVIPLEEVKVQDAKLLDKEDPAKATDVEQIVEKNVEQEIIPNVAQVDEDVKKSDDTRYGDFKEKKSDEEEEAGVSRHDHGIAPQVLEGRKSEYPRG